MPTNPFKPSFGSTPPLLAGRDELILDFGDALDEGPGAPGRATIYTGARGVGKTVMLNEAEDQARQRGWLVISETATPGLLDRLTKEQLPRILADLDPPAKRRKVTGVTIPGVGGVNWANPDRSEAAPSLRRQLEQVTDRLAEHETGLLITVDEIHRNVADDLRQFGAVVQHGFRENRQLAFAGAGLPAAVSGLLNDRVLTFLRRADVHHLGALSDAEAADALRGPIEQSGRHIGADACATAAAATGGYPFLIQLVGYHIWRRDSSEQEITANAVEQGIAAARRRVGSLVLEPSLAEISEVDRNFLIAMTQDAGASRLSDVAGRLGVDTNYASQYRARLIHAELIEPAGYGRIRFTMPYLREYLLDNATPVIPVLGRGRHQRPARE